MPSMMPSTMLPTPTESLEELFESTAEDCIFHGFSDNEDNEIQANPCWKKWHILRLREKLNYLGKNDRGSRIQLIARLEEYYRTLPSKISTSENLWINDSDSETSVNENRVYTDQDDKMSPAAKMNTSISAHDQLLVNIVEILEVLTQNYLGAQPNNHQELQHETISTTKSLHFTPLKSH
jgi:hypothetical protein